VTVDSTTHVVPSHKVDLVLYVKVNDTNDTIGAHQTIDRVDDGVELGYHAQRVAHRDKLSTTSIRILVEVTDGLTLGDHLLAFVRLRFVLVKTEGARILAYDFDVGPAEAGKALASLQNGDTVSVYASNADCTAQTYHLAETWGEVNDICEC
jgi:hypothetical protein